MGKPRAIAFAALGMTALAGTAAAQSGPDIGRDQVVQITPYVWATGVGGHIRPFATSPTVSVDKSFSDLLTDLDAAFFVSAYARRDNLVFMADLSTSSSSRSGDARVPGTSARVPAEAKLRQTSITALAGYRIVATPDATVSLLAGARHWHVRGEVDVPAIGPFPGADLSRSRNFTDPLIAARASFRIAPRWSTLVYADYGGFTVGSRSTSQVLGTVNYQLREHVILSAGYRHLHVDYRDSGAGFDIHMGGPVIGASYRF